MKMPGRFPLLTEAETAETVDALTFLFPDDEDENGLPTRTESIQRIKTLSRFQQFWLGLLIFHHQRPILSRVACVLVPGAILYAVFRAGKTAIAAGWLGS